MIAGLRMRSMSESESSDSDSGALELTRLRTDQCLVISGLDDEEEKKSESSDSSEGGFTTNVGEYVSLFSANEELMECYEDSFGQAMDTITKEVKRNKGPPPELELPRVEIYESRKGRKTVCINAEVLVSTSSCKDKNHTKEVKVKSISLFCQLRKGLDSLRSLSSSFELILFSFSDRDYINSLADLLKSEGLTFDHVLCKNEVPTSTFNALLSDRSANDLIIIDQRVSGFMYILQNGLFVPPFKVEYNRGQVLELLAEFLERVKDEADVRVKLDEAFSIKERFKAMHKNPAMEKVKSVSSNL